MSAADPIRILIAEDVPTDAELSVRELKRAGLRVAHRIEDTEGGFRDAVAEFAPQVILSDFTMPRFDGMQALDLARELAPDTPFIFVSGTLGEEYAIRALKNGATDYVLKTNLIRLPAAVERALAEAQARAERRRTEDALAEARARLVSIMETLPDVLWSATLDGERLHYVSPAARHVLGHAAAALESSPGLWFEIIHPQDKAAVAAALRAAREGESFEIEYRVVRPDGSVRWLSVRGRLIRDAAGAPLRIDGIARDVTEQVAQRKRLARLARIRELTSALNAAIVRIRERGELFEAFCSIAVDKGGFQAAHFLEVAPDSGKLRPGGMTEACRASAIEAMDDYNRDPAGSGTLLAEAMRGGRAAVSRDIRTDSRLLRREMLAGSGIGSIACLPVTIDGRASGAMVLYARGHDFFDDEELALLRELGANLAFALELMDKQKQLDFLAYFDPLTDLPNRAQLRQRVTHAIDAARAAGQRAALVTLDIDRFRTINDAFGQAAGDQILRHVARLAEAALGEHEHAARVGGNQFAILFPLLRGAGELGRKLQQLAASLLDVMVEVHGREIRVAARAGAAIFPDDGSDTETLMANAEAAMKRAKATGERYLFYTPSLNARVAERLDLEARIRRAAERGEFKLAYQPKVDLASGRIAGMEALLRWTNGGGEVSPAQFVPILEETGLIAAVGQWAMREAVATHRAWRARGLPAPRIAVNVSAIQLRSRDFVDDMCAALEGTAGEDCGLDLEITESLLMENMDGSMEKLRALRASGVHIALDDFGTGYSSLAYLGRLPIDTLKIDRAFIRDMTESPEGTTMVSAMISLAHALKLKVVAEGVENEAQAQLLRLLRCDQIQGHLFSRPLFADAVTELLASHTAAAGVNVR